ncbi:benzoate/H(+) symporter BenE family transporter [Rhodococcus sp. BP-252]|uniref:benzoate/H(+) symporter BenE family transporter n=1 Tax=unclassified Rhodococcus (in: high G+C Gram-positive bacteria) TaxID=192944 RepID=UPI00142FE38C|nr:MULTISPECIES: benzoate/H(+) symporter BenE family transporter [unclassified Rhodococcus (in: high G+C Gram-positive bacteria)]NIL75967.1 Inner membrane protein YdcO [Rhodococcus sp. B10]MBY6413969.1 benzoate/H(+) symporter BenE family transporter [Rhodococcus sp. BP-320]MBY6418798.1 benzoate/H(+) symporter BenE family transporter [Rhodococcus sp. BP-321]MBY6423321.1 benzoate/H(+) symporter BenE family transporter [Rhodococcus sp. BP-324]MBY6428833.1 benzoate/H(+) symporter BenE family trans
MSEHENTVEQERSGPLQPVLAGVVAALVGFTSSFAVVLTGLRAVGASPEDAASGLLAICVTQALGMLYLSRRYRQPITLAWSTPGAALLAGTGTVTGGWPAAVGAFVVVGALVVTTGLWPRLGALITSIPTSIAQAMLAGVLLPLCLKPVTAFAASPAFIAPVVLVWLVLQRFSKRWAVPAAFVAAAIVIAVDVVAEDRVPSPVDLVPRVDLTTPQWTWQAIIGIALPLYVVTMASQNIPGMAVMKSFGYDVPWRPAMGVTGLGTVIGAPFGGHAINLAAISAALAAAPQADPDPKRRWIAASSAGWFYLLLALCSAALATLVSVAPAGVVETVAGLALLGTLGASLAGALKNEAGREAAILTFLIAASGVTVLGIGSAFWALVAGLVVRWVLMPSASARP